MKQTGMPFMHIRNIGTQTNLTMRKVQRWSHIDIYWIERATINHLLYHQSIYFMPIRYNIIDDIIPTKG